MFAGKHNPSGYDLYSVGPDGREGNEDDITQLATEENDTAFTLIELILVMAMLTIVISVALPSLKGLGDETWTPKRGAFCR